MLANLVLAHMATGSISWTSPDEYLSIALATSLFHSVAAGLPWIVWRWYRENRNVVFQASFQGLLSIGLIFAFWWP